MAAAAFPFAFLIFLMPLPDATANFLENASVLASTEVTSFLFNVTDTPVLRRGTVFELPGITIQVAQECSGIRSSWVLLITGLLAGNMLLRSNWRRALLVTFVVPLGIIRNGFRVWVIGTLCVHAGPQMIDSAIHRRGGPLFFALSLIPFLVFLWWLRRRDFR
jgi:exosortase